MKTYIVGERVEVIKDVSLAPDGILRAGCTGTVMRIEEGHFVVSVDGGPAVLLRESVLCSLNGNR